MPTTWSTAGRAAEGLRIDRRRGAADGAGGAAAICASATSSVPAFSAAASATPGVPISASTIVGGIEQAVALLVELGDGEDAERHAEMGGGGVERRFIGLDVDGGERGERGGRESLASASVLVDQAR